MLISFRTNSSFTQYGFVHFQDRHREKAVADRIPHGCIAERPVQGIRETADLANQWRWRCHR